MTSPIRKIFIISLILLFSAPVWCGSTARDTTAALGANNAQGPIDKLAGLVIPYNYPLEHHFVNTEDGYILGIFRIPRGAQHVAADKARPVVLLQHGLLDTAAGWLLNGPNRSLAFLLVDAGYDVWLSNSRGTTFSQAHVSLSTRSAAFWRFSWDEMALYDLPAVLGHITSTTGQARVRYVCHSQGGTVALAALASGDPRVTQVVSLAVLMAPVTYVTHVSSLPLVALAALNTDVVFTLLGVREFLPSQALLQLLAASLCVTEPHLCVSFLTALCGYNPHNLDTACIPAYLPFYPGGTSVQNMAHWAQMMRQSRAPRKLLRFDYGTRCGHGRKCNQDEYGSPSPPEFNMSAITTPLVLFSGTKDRLADPVDSELLLESLAPGVVVHRQVDPEYEHLDYIWGMDAVQRVYRPLLQLLAGPGAGDGAARAVW